MGTVVHFINVGQGNMSLIEASSGDYFMFDCNVTDNNEDDVLCYVANQIEPDFAKCGEESMNVGSGISGAQARAAKAHRDDSEYALKCGRPTYGGRFAMGQSSGYNMKVLW